jgi:purine-binding chemotaxis protein CheW
METCELGTRLLIFRVNDIKFGVSLSDVLEILNMQTITPIPHVPNFVVGVMNLRGRIVPVIDLVTRFMPQHQDDVDRNICIVFQQGETLLGALVDEVEEVYTVDSELQPLEQDHTRHFCLGAICRTDSIIQVLDTQTLFSK